MRSLFWPLAVAWLSGCAGGESLVTSDLDTDRPLISARRLPGEHWRSYKRRSGNASAVATAESGVTSLIAPPVYSKEQLQQAFEHVRGTPFVTDKRRLPWMYPADGCFARAARMYHELEDAGFPPPASVYAFGDLFVKTRFDTSGAVSWWYHVAPVVEVDGVQWIIDPAVEPEQPLTRTDWEKRILSEVSTTCSHYTYEPHDSCGQPIEEDRSSFGLEQPLDGWSWTYLDFEQQNLYDLGLNPEPLLTARPPWVAPHQGEQCKHAKECPTDNQLIATCTLEARSDNHTGCQY